MGQDGQDKAPAELGQIAAALVGSKVTIFAQDRRLRYLWVHNPPEGFGADRLIGRSDGDVLPEETVRTVVPVKRKAIARGRRQHCTVAMTLADGHEHWFDLAVEPTRGADGRVTGITCTAIDITDRMTMEQRMSVLMRELAHRSKNLLAVIQGIANQTARTSGSIAQFSQRFSGRLSALAHAQDLLTATNWQGASLDAMVRSQLGPYLEAYGDRIGTAGRPVMLKPNAAQYLGLAIHELGANAARHGALSVPGGTVSVSWRFTPARKDGTRRFVLLWQEHGGLPPKPAGDGHGFGRVMLERIVPQALGAEATLRFAGEGLVYRLVIPEGELARATGR